MHVVIHSVYVISGNTQIIITGAATWSICLRNSIRLLCALAFAECGNKEYRACGKHCSKSFSECGALAQMELQGSHVILLRVWPSFKSDTPFLLNTSGICAKNFLGRI